MRDKFAFTLIELLIVIAIIAIIAAILMPVFATAREKARQTSCASNMKQIGLAFIQYTEDYDEMYPLGLDIVDSGANPNAPTGDGLGWSAQVYPYLKSKAVYACPDDNFVAGTWDMAQGCNAANAAQMQTISYSYNFDIGWYQLPTQGLASNFNSPPVTVLLTEITGSSANPASPEANSSQAGDTYPCEYNRWSTSTDGLFIYSSIDGGTAANAQFATGPMGFGSLAQEPETGNYDGCQVVGAYGCTTIPTGPSQARHSAGANFLMCDGHVKWLIGNHVSIGNTATNQNNAQTTTSTNAGRAAGTSALTAGNYAVTYSPV